MTREKKNPASRRDFWRDKEFFLAKAEKIAVVDKENTQEDNAFAFGNLAVIGSEDKEQKGDKEHDTDVNIVEVEMRNVAKKGHRNAENDADIENIAANNITEGKIVFAAAGGSDAGNEFWERSAESDDGHGDEFFTDAESSSESGSGIDHEVTAENNTNDTADGKK